MSKTYELTLLCKDEAYDQAIDRFLELCDSWNVKILKYENEGRKRLSYSIQGREWCTYAYFVIEIDVVGVGIFSSNIDHIDAVLRYLLVQSK